MINIFQIIQVLILTLSLTSVASADEGMERQAKLKIVNLSSKVVKIRDGEVTWSNSWRGKPCPYYFMDPLEEKEKKIPCNASYHVAVDVCRSRGERSIGVLEYFRKHHGEYVIYAAGYGASLYITSGLGDELFNKLTSQDNSLAEGLERTAGRLGLGDDAGAQATLRQLLDASQNESRRAVVEGLAGRLAGGLSELARKTIAHNPGALLAMALGHISGTLMEKNKDSWLGQLYAQHPEFMSLTLRYAPLVISQVAKVAVPPLAELARAHPYMTAEIIALIPLLYYVYNWYQTSPHASCTVATAAPDEYEDEQEIEVCIRDYGDYTISVDHSG